MILNKSNPFTYLVVCISSLLGDTIFSLSSTFAPHTGSGHMTSSCFAGGFYTVNLMGSRAGKHSCLSSRSEIRPVPLSSNRGGLIWIEVTCLFGLGI